MLKNGKWYGEGEKHSKILGRSSLAPCPGRGGKHRRCAEHGGLCEGLCPQPPFLCRRPQAEPGAEATSLARSHSPLECHQMAPTPALLCSWWPSNPSVIKSHVQKTKGNPRRVVSRRKAIRHPHRRPNPKPAMSWGRKRSWREKEAQTGEAGGSRSKSNGCSELISSPEGDGKEK